MNRPVRTDLPGADGEQPVQEGVSGFGSLEARQRTKVGSSWRSVVTDALERHVDEGAVVGLERDAEVELDDAVGASDRPIIAARQSSTLSETLPSATGSSFEETGTSIASAWGTRTRSASMPPCSVPESGCMPKSESTGYASQFAVWPAAQERHVPQLTWNATATR